MNRYQGATRETLRGLRRLLRGTARTFKYVYDFCYDWHHAGIVEAVNSLPPRAPRTAQVPGR